MKKINIDLRGNDVEAIVTALEVVVSLGLEETEDQAEINAQMAYFAGIKLQNKNPNLQPNEARMVCAAVDCARLILCGALEVDPEQKKELAPFLFNYNRLWPQLQQIADMLP